MKVKPFEAHKKYQAPEAAGSISVRISSPVVDMTEVLKKLFS